jgi:hypothetical protein
MVASRPVTRLRTGHQCAGLASVVRPYTQQAVDDYGSRGTGKPADDGPVGKGRAPEPDPVYDWGGKPGEDFGPMPAPPGAAAPGSSAPAGTPVPGPAPWPEADPWPAPETAARPIPADREPSDPSDTPEPPTEHLLSEQAWSARPSPVSPPVDDTAPLLRPEREPRFHEGGTPDEWTRTTPIDRGPAGPWNEPDVRYDPDVPIDVDVDAATSVRRSVGRGAVPLSVRRQRRRPLAGLVALLIVLGVLVGVVFAVLSRQNAPLAQTAPSTPAPTPVAGAASPGAAPGLAILPIATSTVVRAGPSPVLTFTPEAVVLDEPTPDAPAAAPPPAAASPEPTLTPLALGPPSGTPFPGTPRAGIPTPRTAVRSTPAGRAPTMPALVTPPPGVRFPTSTPARVAQPTRTPPTVPTVRPLTFTTRIWSEQTLHRQGDDASICGQATTGASAEMFVLGPDRTNQALGQFTPPAERVCTALKLDTVGLYVLTLIVKDGSGNETDRQSAALYVSR